ncbi:PucR family transcriptional regulator [Lentzea sp. NEAU-D13]|uniref:PucR family transcriptional regulator n=1 Tax=Lentzea alba TaxID=2714351 RepID=A0A7C9RUU0_9PSEU|nr:helix-turn-helix domain-containing protein [Lentzea alba]NGY63267.1 PucR family transcriptional regulator [Lentzea alba]
MTEVAVNWSSTPGRVRRAPRLAGEDDVRLAEFRAKIRAAGENWAGGRYDDLLGVLEEAAEGHPAFAEFVRASGPVLTEFLDGYRRRNEGIASARRGDVAGDLVDGHPIAPDVYDALAARYLIVVVRLSDVTRTKPVLHEAAGPGAFMTRKESGLVILVPDLDPERTPAITRQLTRHLDGKGWLTVAARPKADIADGYREAADVMRLVVAGRRPGGVYNISDVLVEYAVTRHEHVTRSLVSILDPLRAHPVLWETLVALVDADLQRNQTARNLFVHRSTLDYRLQRIAGITGCDPTSGRGGHTLVAAMIADGYSG